MHSRRRTLQLVRALTGRYDLHARAALDLVEVWPCVKLPSDSYRFRPTNSSHCYEYIPIVLDFANSSSTVFLDPRTMVVTHESPLSPCELSREQPIMLEGALGSGSSDRTGGSD